MCSMLCMIKRLAMSFLIQLVLPLEGWKLNGLFIGFRLRDVTVFSSRDWLLAK